MSSSTTSSSHHTTPHQSPPLDQSTTAYLTYPVSHVVSGLYRRLTESSPSPSPSNNTMPASSRSSSQNNKNTLAGIYAPPLRTASPYQPPPLTPLSLHVTPPAQSPSYSYLPLSPTATHLILAAPLAEEIRLLVPPRLQLVTDWTLAYSVDRDGVSLATLYKKCADYKGRHNGFVLVVKDGAGGIFGAFLTDPPAPQSHYYGTGECFLWRSSILPLSSILASLPPPPSEDTTHYNERSTTIGSPTVRSLSKTHISAFSEKSGAKNGVMPRSGTSTPERIRFKAFPYSGVNDYVMFCEHDYLSVGAGDGKYGLWLDRVLERGISSHCMTFGNEGLSEEGEKFEIVGVEVWYLGT